MRISGLLIKADSLYKYNSTKPFDSKTELYWDEMEQIWFCKKVGKLGIEYLPLWKNFSILYHIHGILNLVLAGNSNVVEITKDNLISEKILPLEVLTLNSFLNSWIQPLIEAELDVSSRADSLLITCIVKHVGYLLVKAITSLRTMECFSSSSLPMVCRTKSKASWPFS